jgi:hypothetical protein
MIATSACTKSGEDVAPGGAGGIGTGEKGRLTFVLPTADRVVTYTGGSAAENGSTSDLVAVYVFDSSLRFERSYNLFYADGADIQGGRRYSLTMDGTGERRFVSLQAPSVNMKRRVARFDVVSDASVATVTEVLINNASATGRLLDDGSAPTAPSSGGVSYELSP